MRISPPRNRVSHFESPAVSSGVSRSRKMSAGEFRDAFRAARSRVSAARPIHFLSRVDHRVRSNPGRVSCGHTFGCRSASLLLPLSFLREPFLAPAHSSFRLRCPDVGWAAVFHLPDIVASACPSVFTMLSRRCENLLPRIFSSSRT